MASGAFIDSETGQTRIALRALLTSDLHGHLMAYDYAADQGRPGVGLVRLASLIAAARAEADNSILLDNGDFLFGSMLADDWVAMAAPRPPNPVVLAMGALGYDAVALGNHEFNFGLETLAEALKPAPFPVLCSNLSPLSGDVALPARQRLLIRRQLVDDAGATHEVTIGLVAVLPPQVMQWDAAHLRGRLSVRGMVNAARDEVAALRRAGADLVFVMNHSGLGDGSDAEEVEDAGLAIARLPGVDAVFCGHRHQLFPGPHYDGNADVDAQAGTLAGVPALMPGCWGSHLGVLDLDLVWRGQGWQMARHRAGLRGIARRAHGRVVSTVDDAPDIAALAAPAHRATLSRMRRVVGRVSCDLSTHFSQVGPCRVSALVAAAQAWRARQLLGDGSRLPLLSAAAPFRCGGAGGPEHYTDLPAGPVQFRDVVAIYPYPNTLRVLALTGAQIREWLEHVAGQFHQLAPDRGAQPLLVAGFPAYHFDILHGLRYGIDPSAPPRYAPDGRVLNRAASRIRDLTWQGRPVTPEQEFLVVTNSHRAHGGGNVAALASARIVAESDEPIPDILHEYLAAGHDLPEGAAQVWHFVPLPGLRATLRSSPNAQAHRVSGLSCAGMDRDGFARFVLQL